jgi:hypothetical protein
LQLLQEMLAEEKKAKLTAGQLFHQNELFKEF